MMFETHIVSALLFLSFFYGSDNFLLFALIVLIAVIIPDLDSSIIFFKHRGFLHSLTFAILISLGIYGFIGMEFAKPFFFGYSLHILGDAFSVSGVSILWPLSHKIKFNIYKTGGIREAFILYLLTFALVIKVYLILS